MRLFISLSSAANLVKMAMKSVHATLQNVEGLEIDESFKDFVNPNNNVKYLVFKIQRSGRKPVIYCGMRASRTKLMVINTQGKRYDEFSYAPTPSGVRQAVEAILIDLDLA